MGHFLRPPLKRYSASALAPTIITTCAVHIVSHTTDGTPTALCNLPRLSAISNLHGHLPGRYVVLTAKSRHITFAHNTLAPTLWLEVCQHQFVRTSHGHCHYWACARIWRPNDFQNEIFNQPGVPTEAHLNKVNLYPIRTPEVINAGTSMLGTDGRHRFCAHCK